MKIKRFFAIFLCLFMFSGLWAVSAAAVEDPEILAPAALLVDVETDAVAYAKNEHQAMYPASLTKVMTALLVLDAVQDGRLSMDTEITASSTAMLGLDPTGSTANIKVGETMTVRNLLYCMLVVSANEACNILAEAVSGSVETFVSQMNGRAAELGCETTHFVNPSGLHDPEHYTSAWDLYLITKAAMAYPDFMTICDTANVIIPATNLSKERNYWTTNHLLSNWRVIGYRNKEAHGIKTGSTSDAGYCLISSATRGRLHFVSVILGAERVEENGVGNIRSFSETTRMFNYGFENFGYRTILEKSEIIQEVPVTLSKTDYVTVHPARELKVLFPNDLDPEDLTCTVSLKEETVEAPVSAGQKMGEITLSYGKTVYGVVDLLASNDVEVDSKQVMMKDIRLFFQKPSVRYALIGGAALLVVLAALLLILRGKSRRRRYGSSGGHSGNGGYRGGRRRR